MRLNGTHNAPIALLVAVMTAVVGVAAHAQSEGGTIRTTILLSEQPRGAAPVEADMCTDLHERVTLALTAPTGGNPEEQRAAYERIVGRARPSIPVDERILTLFAKNAKGGRVCGAGCGVVEFSASCVRSYLQVLEDCLRQGNLLACAVHYDCSVACAPLPPEHAVAEEPEKPSWFGPLLRTFDRLIETQEEIDPIIPVSDGEEGAGSGGGSVTPESAVPEEPAPLEEEKQRHAAPEEEVAEPQPEPALLPTAVPPEPELLPLPAEEPKEEPVVEPPPQEEVSSPFLEYEEWKRRWDEYWERWGRGEENLGPPPELPPWLSDASTQWQENIHSEQPPECAVCEQYWGEQVSTGAMNETKPPECQICEQYWQTLYSHER